MTCDPASLMDSAKCIECGIPPGRQLPVLISLLCQIANASAPPDLGFRLTPSSFSLGEFMTFAIPGTGFSDNVAGLTDITYVNNVAMGFSFFGAQDLVSFQSTTLTIIGSSVFVPTVGLIVQDCGSLTTLAFPALTTIHGIIDVENMASLTTFSLPALSQILDSDNGAGIKLSALFVLTSFSLPSLTQIEIGGIDVEDNTLLQTLSFPSLTTANGTLFVQRNAALTTIDLRACNTGTLTPDPGGGGVNDNPVLTTIRLDVWNPGATNNYDFARNALSAATVNQILSRLVAKAAWGTTGQSVFLNGGTNAAPTGQGVVDKATLIGRGATVTTN